MIIERTFYKTIQEGDSIRPNKNIFAVDISGVSGSRSTDPKDIEQEVKAVFEASLGKEEAELVTKGITQVVADTKDPPTQNTSGNQSTTPPANQTATQATTPSTTNTTQSSSSKQSSFTPVNADDDFLRGFNEGYEDEQPTSQTSQIKKTRPYVWEDSRQELGITEVTADPPSYKYITGYAPLFDERSRTPEVRALREKEINPIYDPFLDGFNEGYEDKQEQTRLPGKRGSPNPEVSGYTGAWEPVQQDIAGSGFQIRAWTEDPQLKTEEELRIAYEKAKSRFDAVSQELERYMRENRDWNTPWYDALSREYGQAYEQYTALKDQYTAHHQSERSGESDWGLLEWLSMVGYSGDSTLPLNNATVVTNELRNRPEQVAYEQSLEEKVSAQKQDNKNQIKDWANEHPILATGASLLTKPIAMVDYLNTLVQYNAIGDVLPSEAPAITEATDAMREGASENMSKAGQFVYNTVVSAADSVIAGLLGNGHIGGAIILGAGTASDTANDIMERGGSEEDALIGGAVSGILEGVFEKISLGQLEAMKALPADTIKNILGNIAKSVATNASEEGLTELANTIFDTIFMGELSTYALTVQGYMSQGKSEADAKKLANGDLFARLCESAASGALMGVLFGGGASASSYYRSQLAAQGEAKLRAKEMPMPRELEALNASEAEARGAMVMLNLDQFDGGSNNSAIEDNLHNESRPTWKQSELDAAGDFPNYDAQQSFLNGEPVPYGTKGSVRPDYYSSGHSVDIKNYNVETTSGRRNLAHNVQQQYFRRVENLPDGTLQSVMVDIRGQHVTDSILSELYDDLMKRTDGNIEVLFKMK